MKSWYEKRIIIIIIKTKVNALERVNTGNLIKMVIVELGVDKVTVRNCWGDFEHPKKICVQIAF